MNKLSREIILGIDEPWDSSKVISGNVVGSYHSTDGKKYFTVEDILTGEVYVLTNRYEDDNLSDVFSGKTVIVAIALPKTRNFTYEDPDFLSHLSYFGLGHIQIY